MLRLLRREGGLQVDTGDAIATVVVPGAGHGDMKPGKPVVELLVILEEH